MKYIFGLLTLPILLASQSVSACPNFSGKYSAGKSSVWAEETTYEITQVGCEKMKIVKTLQSVGHIYQPVTLEMIVDGVRRLEDFPNIYWVNSWENNRLVREPWTAQAGGELVGDRAYWFLKPDAQGKISLVFQLVDDSGNLLSEEIVKKL